MSKLLDSKQAQRLLKSLESDPRLQAPDDATIPDYGVVITGGPTAVKTGNADSPSAIYLVTAGAVPVGPAATYQWEFSPNNLVWASLVGDTGIETISNATAQMTVSNIYATPNVVNGYVRVVVGAAGTTDTATSTALQVVAGS